MPFNSDRLDGFDNRIAALIAAGLHTRVEYSWASLRRGFLRRTLEARACDVVMGLPEAMPGLSLTEPYYATSYALVFPASSRRDITGFDDPSLRTARIGLHAINAGGVNPPPARSLSARALQGNMLGYALWGHTGETQSQGRIIDAVASAEVDVAVVWGPIAGYFAKQHAGTLTVTPVVADEKLPALPIVHALSTSVCAKPMSA